MTIYCGINCPSTFCPSSCDNYNDTYQGPGGRYRLGTVAHYNQWKDRWFGFASNVAEREERDRDYKWLTGRSPQDLAQIFEDRAAALEEVVKRRSCCLKARRIVVEVARAACVCLFLAFISSRTTRGAISAPNLFSIKLESPDPEYEYARLAREYANGVSSYVYSKRHIAETSSSK